MRILLALALSVAAADAPALRGLDPILLARGVETAGKPEYAAAHTGYLYHFASSENKRLFESDPDRYAIQLEGACARMGPATGKGAPDRFAVHDGRIYIFASEQCRNTFTADPAGYIDRPDRMPEFSADAAERGRALIGKAVAAHGGARAIDGVATYVEHASTDANEAARQPSLPFTWSAKFPAHFRDSTEYAGYGAYGNMVTPAGAFNHSPGKLSANGPLTSAHVRRGFLRHPLALLRSRNSGDFRVWSISTARAGVFFDGMLLDVDFDPATGRIAAIGYTGRAGGARVGRIVHRYADYREAGGLQVAHRVVTELDGKPSAARSLTVARVAVDGELAAALFDASAATP